MQYRINNVLEFQAYFIQQLSELLADGYSMNVLDCLRNAVDEQAIDPNVVAEVLVAHDWPADLQLWT